MVSCYACVFCFCFFLWIPTLKVACKFIFSVFWLQYTCCSYRRRHHHNHFHLLNTSFWLDNRKWLSMAFPCIKNLSRFEAKRETLTLSIGRQWSFDVHCFVYVVVLGSCWRSVRWSSQRAWGREDCEQATWGKDLQELWHFWDSFKICGSPVIEEVDYSLKRGLSRTFLSLLSTVCGFWCLRL